MGVSEGVHIMLFRKKITRSCEYCVHCAKVSDEQMLCAKKGLVPPDARCRKFMYDPFKRVPPRFKAVDFSKYSTDDFFL